MVHYSNSTEETQEIAKEFAKTLAPGDVVLLHGGLGAGKTAFTRGLTYALGYSDYFGSPTFTIVNCYQGEMPVYHFDAYRIEEPEEMYDIGYDEYIYGDGISVIEWPEKISEVLPDERYEVTIEKDLEKGEDFRKITIERTEK